MAHRGSETTRGPCQAPAQPNAQAPMNSCEDEASVSFLTVLGRISRSAALPLLRRQVVNVAFHPGGRDRLTCAAATRRGVAAAQNSDWPSLVALTT